MRKVLLVTAVVLAVLAAAAWIGDSFLRRTAEDRAASALQSSLGLSQKPEVTIDGFPFALSLLTGSVPGAHASAGAVPVTVSGHDLRISGVRVRASGISLSGDRAHVAEAEATGVLDYGSIADLAGVPVAYGGDGRLKLVYTTQVAGQQVNVGVTAVPVLDAAGGTIRLTKPKLDTDAAAPVPVTAAQVSRLARPIPMKLPGSAKLTALTPSEGGVAVGARVSDLTFAVR